MKKLFIVIVFIVSFASVQGQYNYSKFNYYSLGLRLGPDMFSYDLDEVKNITKDDNFNFTIGVEGAYFITWLFELHASINWSSRNMTLLWNYPTDPDALAKSEYKLNYLNVPIEIRFNALYLNWMKLNIGAGIMPDFRFRPKEFLTYQDGRVDESIKFWSTKNFTSVLFAFPLSVNATIYINRHYNIALGVGYNVYVNKIHKDYLVSPANSLIIRAGMSYDW